MSEDNKQLEVNLGNQVEETDQVNAENFSNPDDQKSATSPGPQSSEQVSSTTQTNEATTDNVLLETEKILSVLAEQLQSNEPARELLSQLQQIMATLNQNQENLLQTNETLSEQIEEENQKIEALQRRYVGLVAEFDNFRKRTQREKEDLEKQAKRKTLGELLAVVDNFERARLQIKPANEGEMEIHKSYQGVYKNLVESLKRLGVSAMRPEGEPFDPIYHEAMLREPTNEYPEGTVIEQLVRGYLLEDQVLRHAMVKVAAPKEVETDETQTAESIKEAQESTP